MGTTQKKKVLILPGALSVGGAEKIARDIGLYADPGAFAVHYLVFGENIGAYEEILQARGCRVIHVPPPSRNYGSYVWNLFRLMEREGYHAVHAHTMFSCGWAMGAAKLAGVPVRIAHAHSSLLDGGGWMKRCYEALMRFWILRCATILAACAEPAGKRLFGEKVWAARGLLLPNGIDCRAFTYREEDRRAIRAQYDLEHCLVLGHAGHLTAVKNQQFLLELLDKLLEKQKNCRLLLVGEGEDRPRLEASIRFLGLDGHVILSGNVEDMAPFYSAMDVFCLPSLYEGMPLALLEARANGLPCLVSDRVEAAGLSLEDRDAWIAAVCCARRGPAQPVPDIREAMERVYTLYE